MSLLYACSDRPVDRGDPGRAALLHCAALAVAYVGALHCVVPRRVRRLPRDDPRQIRWRGGAALLVSAGAAVASHWFLFCGAEPPPDDPTTPDDLMTTTSTIALIIRSSIHATGSVLLHTAILYLGPIVTNVVRVYERVKRRDAGAVSLRRMASVFYAACVEPTVAALLRPRSDSERWFCLRYLVLAPLTEEIVFRACMVPVLADAAGMRPGRVSLTAPLFFGVAHAHHAALKLREGYRLSQVLLGTAFQFAYTSVFGAYASYAYLRTRSLVAVTVCHAFCNCMGLPDLSFLSTGSPLYRYRMGLATALVGGLAGFILMITWLGQPPLLATTAAAAFTN